MTAAEKYSAEQKLKRSVKFRDGILRVDQSKLQEEYLPIEVKTRSGHLVNAALKLDCKFYSLSEAPEMIGKPHVMYRQWWIWVSFITLFSAFWVAVAYFFPG